MKATVATFSIVVALATFSQARADDVCQPQNPGASLELGTLNAGNVYVPVKIAGHQEDLVVDTAAPFSALSDSTATALGLSREHVPYRMFILVNGYPSREYADAPSTGLGAMNASGIRFAVVPDAGTFPDTEGMVGADVLRQFGLDFDFADGKLFVYAHGQCAPAWTRQAGTPPALIGKTGLVVINAVLDGKKITAGIKTGALTSTMYFPSVIDRFGWGDRPIGIKTVHSTDGTPDEFSFSFKELSFYGVSMLHPPMVIQSRVATVPEVILGQDILRRLRVYIDYDNVKVYVAPATAR